MAEFNLPEGWVNTHLDSLTKDISYGYTASSTENNVGPRMLRITDIQDNHVEWKNVPFCEIDDSKVEKYLLQRNDLVFARTGATVGKSYLIRSEPPQAVYASYLIRVRTASDDLISMLAHFFNSSQYWQQITEFSSGIGQPNVNGTKLKNLIVPLPPLAEQKVIAEKLDTLLAQVDNTKARLERIPEILKRFRQSVLAAAVSGKLTEEWRESNDLNSQLDYREVCLNERLSALGKKNIKLAKLQEQPKIDLPESWSWQALDEVNIKITDGTHHSPQSFPDGDYMYVTSKNVREGRIDLGNVTFVDEKTHRDIFSRCDVKYGDVLYVKDGANTGLSCVNNITEEFSLLSSVGVLRTCSFMEPTYVQHYLNSPIGRKLMLDLMGGTAIKRLTLTKIAVSPISVPHKKEQTEIVRRVEELFAFADRIEQAAHAALSRVNNLTQSILAKAFRGELTADWRAANPELINGENSAEALLARIKAERAKVKTRKKD